MLVPLSNVASISAGQNYACALLTDGSVACWGDDGYHGGAADPLGIEQNAKNPFGTVLDAEVIGATAISAGQTGACALFLDGTVSCWGLYAGARSMSPPVKIDGLVNVSALAVGQITSYFELKSGSVIVWGGYDSLATPTPFDAPAGTTGISPGGNQSCAIQADSSVLCWTSPLAKPTALAGLTGATEISAGSDHVCALVGGGAVKCWGMNGYGQLGNGTTRASLQPVDVTGLRGVISVKASTGGASFTCALMDEGTVTCWGGGGFNKLGSGANSDSAVPVPVAGLTGATAIAAAGDFACAVMADTTVKCWGLVGEDGRSMKGPTTITIPR